jgi:hypothetical protein
MNKQIFIIASSVSILFCISCGNSEASKTTNNTITAEKIETTPEKTRAPAQSSAIDDAAIATIETSDFILKVHKAIPFSLKPKSYQPFKVDPSTKLIVLDVSVRNKLSTPLNFSRILGMTVIKGKGDKGLLAPWVVAAYEVDYAEPNHQKEYDALWSEHFEPNGFHRAILFGMNPSKEEKEFTLIVPEKPDFNNPSKKTVQFSVE